MPGLRSPSPEQDLKKRSHMAAGQHEARPNLSTLQQTTKSLASDGHHKFNLHHAFGSLNDSLCVLGLCRLCTQEGGARST